MQETADPNQCPLVGKGTEPSVLFQAGRAARNQDQRLFRMAPARARMGSALGVTRHSLPEEFPLCRDAQACQGRVVGKARAGPRAGSPQGGWGTVCLSGWSDALLMLKIIQKESVV